MRKISLLLFLLFSSAAAFAQHTLPLSEDVSKTDFYWNNSDAHSTVKPGLDVDLYGRKLYGEDTLAVKQSFPKEDLSWRYYHKNTSDGMEHKASFLLRPIYDFNAGKDFAGNRALYSTVAGAILDAGWKQKLSIEARFATGTTVLPNYLDSAAKFSGVMPGWGDRAYPQGNGKYSFQHFSGNIIWRPTKIFNLQLGRDKHFWGDGYRSLFLSDVGAAMPYIKQTTTIWKLQYTSLFTWMQDWTHSNGSAQDFRSKFGTFHYLSFNAARWLNIGVFESVIWQGNDPNRKRAYDINYLNPLIFFRPVEYSLGSADNSMLGFSFKIRFNENNQLYGQLLLDEFYLKEILAHNGWWANKQGYQLGYKCFNFGQLKNLFMQTEINIVRPYTYSHGSTQQNYANAGMPLAHPLGANFAELLGMLSYSYKGLTVTGKLVGARYGLDTAGTTVNLGQNINKSYLTRDHEYGNGMFQGVATNMFLAEFRAAYQFNTAFPLRIELLAGARSERNYYSVKKSSYIQLGLSLPLWRTYRDY